MPASQPRRSRLIPGSPTSLRACRDIRSLCLPAPGTSGARRLTPGAVSPAATSARQPRQARHDLGKALAACASPRSTGTHGNAAPKSSAIDPTGHDLGHMVQHRRLAGEACLAPTPPLAAAPSCPSSLPFLPSLRSAYWFLTPGNCLLTYSLLRPARSGGYPGAGVRAYHWRIGGQFAARAMTAAAKQRNAAPGPTAGSRAWGAYLRWRFHGSRT